VASCNVQGKTTSGANFETHGISFELGVSSSREQTQEEEEEEEEGEEEKGEYGDLGGH
jgi:hypothetical protein